MSQKQNKYKHDIPLVMNLAMNAGRAVQLAYYEQKTLPKTLEVNVLMTSAIPASEYTPDKAKHLEERFLKDSHVVIVYVGEEQVTVTLNFDRVKVIQEGVPALYALIESDEQILQNFHKRYEEVLSPKDFRNKKNSTC